VPLKVAVVSPTAWAEPVATTGAPAVVNVRSAPADVPDAFDATSRKWYVVPGVSPVTAVETFVEPVPAPVPLLGVAAP
jgi:hypothetical protein